ncbi:MAG: AAA family ATPase, partial [Boseongicola sp.]|nr:AAA family ATPase [Boseongicola sp.]
MHAHRVVVSSLVAGAPTGGLQSREPLPALSGVLSDFIRQLLELRPRESRRTRRNQRLAESFEQGMLRGRIISNYETGYPEYSYMPQGWKRELPLMNASSMVSELAPVVLYLRHIVKPGDLLIIEEPESHLHPAMQVEFTKQLAAAVNAGIRVLITTHSEIVLEEIANLVRLSDIPKGRRRGIPEAAFALSGNDVGAWFFEPKD